MGRRGPAPKPSALKRAADNPGKRQLNDNEPVPPAGEVLAPDWLTDDAKKIWEQLAPRMQAMQVLTTADVLTFGRYCELFARWHQLRELMWVGNRATYVVKDESGKKVKYVAEHPANVELRRLTAQLLQHEREFGLTPSARSRIQITSTTAPTRPVDDDADASREQTIRNFFAGGGPAKPTKGKVVG